MNDYQVYRTKYDCSGCGACKDICNKNAITMTVDEEGFLYPSIDPALCVRCGACESICPQKDSFEVISDGDSTGYAIKHKNDEVRGRSTSGGAFTAIINAFYELHPGGAVYGVVLDFSTKDSEGLKIYHKRAGNIEECFSFRGSKYVQSDMTEVFSLIREDLSLGNHVLFTGTPCQTAAIYARFHHRLDYDHIYLVDIICHSAPSPLMFNEHIKLIETKTGKKVTDYMFRSKITGWAHNEVAIFGEKKMFRNKLSQNHKLLFYSDYISRPVCSVCRFAACFNRPSDITIGDFWGIENIAPTLKDAKGVSLVTINSAKGRSLYNIFHDDVVGVVVSVEQAFSYNHNKACKENPRRAEFWLDYKKYGFQFVIAKYTDHAFVWKMKKILRYFLSEKNRSYLKRIMKRH